MKPRLESAALTDEDCVTLVFIGEKHGHCGLLEAHGRYLEADRRDADLMLSLESHKANGAPRHLVRWGQLLGFGGPFRAFVRIPQRDPTGDITNFA